MKLDIWEAISSILDAGGIFKYGRYEIRDRNGLRHRDDGPAVIYPNGTQCWYRDGNLHRDDGPAVIYPHGTQYWYLNGKIQSKKINET
jgi:hypothetical protein